MVLGVAAALLGPGAQAATCESDAIARVSADGTTIEMRSGRVFEIDPSGRPLAATWPPVSDMVICQEAIPNLAAGEAVYSLSNRDDDGQIVEGHPLKR